MAKGTVDSFSTLQGRTSFQTKMASQMFDQPTNTLRSPGSARHVRPLEQGKCGRAAWPTRMLTRTAVAVDDVRARSNLELHEHAGPSGAEVRARDPPRG